MLISDSGTAQQEINKKRIVIIDPGHGGKDSGALGFNGIQEKDITLQIALEILRLNSQDDPMEIYLTRSTDSLITLKDRSRLTKAVKPDLFISIHLNHAPDPFATGIEVFVDNIKNSENLRESIFVATEIHNSFTSGLGFKSRGVKFGNFQVLRESVKFAPSILLELCFLSNPDEATFISQKDNLRKTAQLIYKGVSYLILP